MSNENLPKPEKKSYYDYWEVIHFLAEKHSLDKCIGDVFIEWLSESNDTMQNGSLICLDLTDQNCPKAIKKLLLSMQEFETKKNKFKNLEVKY